MSVIPFREIAHLFTEFEHTAWRLETRRGYASDRDSPKWQRWRQGGDIVDDPANPWRANVQMQVAAGKRFERVRLVDEPLTDGQQFLLASGIGNVQAGEDIRNLRRADAERLGLPAFDFWLFDSRLLAQFHFDEDDRTLGVELITESAQVLAACQARDAAWHHAVPTVEFAARVASAV
ncbi:hypothetical protein P3T37_000107 [Kitasatospora sp. MAA4]|uniref:DUF6879 family protein n=1 Tax=Kitasatospora sp. MAA4 TaxID=3035093 RepID=UPI00247436F6|nr:DUF6879 family protein [Kitasatospora sp. MAA4]MDH6130740.1 hypothetical protein [Kitasatospora sp. MAA4]